MERNYFTKNEFLNEALRRAKSDPEWAEAEKGANLKDFLPCTGTDSKLVNTFFVPYGYASLEMYKGKFENVEGEVLLRWTGGHHDTMLIMTSHGADRQAFLSMQTLCGLIAHYMNQVMLDNLNRFIL